MIKKSKGEPEDRASAWNMKREKSKWKHDRAAGIMKRKKSEGEEEEEDRTAASEIREGRVKGNKAKQQGIQRERRVKETKRQHSSRDNKMKKSKGKHKEKELLRGTRRQSSSMEYEEKEK